MNNIIEIIIKAVTKDAEKNIKKVDSSLTKLGKVAAGVGRALKTITIAAVAAVAILYTLARAIEAAAERAEQLGRRDVKRAFDEANFSAQQLVDTLLTVKIAGVDAFDVIKVSLELLSKLLIQAAVSVEMLAGGMEIWGVIGHRALSVMIHDTDLLLKGALGFAQVMTHFPVAAIPELAKGFEELSQEEAEAEIALIRFNHEQRIALITSGQLEVSLKEVGKSMAMTSQQNMKGMNTLQGLIIKNKQLNSVLSKRRSIDDAIRAGDARALAELQSGGSGGSTTSAGTRTSNRTGNVPSGRGATATQALPDITIILGGKVLNSAVDDIIINGVRNAKHPSPGGRKK